MSLAEDTTFEELGLIEELLKPIASAGFKKPTPIQAQAIGPLLAGKDLVGCAQTGTGKTAAFCLPILQQLCQRFQDNPGVSRVLIMAPTRELAAQINTFTTQFCRHTPFRSVLICGGVNYAKQELALRAGRAIIVATPGRLLDHYQNRTIDFSEMSFVVLDEADRMLDMGFYPDIRRILSLLPTKKQVALFSATVPPSIMQMADQFMQHPVRITVGAPSRPVEKIKQEVVYVEWGQKRQSLTHLIDGEEGLKQALIFVNTKRTAHFLSRFMTQKGYQTLAIHGDLSQAQRTRALNAFRNGESRFLVATDVAARGLDINEVSHVINFDLPNTAEDYVHRVGRTGRAEADGTAYTFVSAEDRMNFIAIGRQLKLALAEKDLKMPAQDLSDMLACESLSGGMAAEYIQDKRALGIQDSELTDDNLNTGRRRHKDRELDRRWTKEHGTSTPPKTHHKPRSKSNNHPNSPRSGGNR